MIIIIIIIIIIAKIFIYLFNVKYNTNSYTKNYNIANKFRQNPRRRVYCFDCKIPLRSFTFNSVEILHVSTTEQ